MNQAGGKWPDPQDQARAAPLAMTVLAGWTLVLRCKACGQGRAWSPDALLRELGSSLALPRAAVADRARCACGAVGAWVEHMGTGALSAWIEEGGSSSGMTHWQAEDVHLRRLLAAHRLPLSIADLCWVEIRNHCGKHPDWKPRWPEIPGAPLSEAAKHDPGLLI